MTDYKVIKRINEDLVMLSSEYGIQLFSKVILRKNTVCEQLGIEINTGNKAYRPTTNGYNRSHRISIIAMNNLNLAK